MGARVVPIFVPADRGQRTTGVAARGAKTFLAEPEMLVSVAFFASVFFGTIASEASSSGRLHERGVFQFT